MTRERSWNLRDIVLSIPYFFIIVIPFGVISSFLGFITFVIGSIFIGIFVPMATLLAVIGVYILFSIILTATTTDGSSKLGLIPLFLFTILLFLISFAARGIMTGITTK